jgi:hypothetical protein
MESKDELDEYRTQLREDVCSRCIARLPNAPPCGLLGKGCGIERHLEALVNLCRTTESTLMEPYVARLHEEICPTCDLRDKPACPCPLDYLLQLAIEAVEKVERRRAAKRM